MNKIYDLASEWLSAREAVLDETTKDVRVSDTFRVALNRLSDAEDALAKGVREVRRGEDP